MKLIFSLMVCIGCFNLSVLHQSHPFMIPETEQVQETSPINLKGEFKKGGLRSGTDPIVVELQGGSTLYTYFQKDLGTLAVTIVGEEGQVFYTTVNTTSQSVLIIPLTGLPAGSYTITFSNEYGYMTGVFDL